MNWKKIFGAMIKGAEVAAPIIATKDPNAGKVISIGAEGVKAILARRYANQYIDPSWKSNIEAAFIAGYEAGQRNSTP